MRRRTILAACSAGLGGLAGCSGLRDLGGDEAPDVDTRALAEEFDPVGMPSGPFPVQSLVERADAHDRRANALLADVPADPSIPNAAVAEQLAAERPETPPPATPPADRWPMWWLDDWRGHRSAAATVWGAYRAATGTDDSDLVTERRRAIRHDLGAVRAETVYRASDPVAAVLGHAPVEELVRDGHQHVEPKLGYPDDPVAAPLQTGEALGGIERARGAVADARALRSTVAGGAEVSHWETLARGSRRLRRSFSETTEGLEPYVRRREDAFSTDLAGTNRWLFDETVDALEYQRRDAREAGDDGRYATAILETGRAMLAAERLSAVVAGISDDRFPDEPSAEQVRDAATAAREALEDSMNEDQPALVGALARPAVFRQRGVIEEMAEGYRDASRAYAGFTHVAMHARGVPEAGRFVAAQLTATADR